MDTCITNEQLQAIVKHYLPRPIDPNGDDPQFWDAISSWHSEALSILESYEALAPEITPRGEFCSGYILMHATQSLLEDMFHLLNHFCCGACAKDPVVRRYVKEALDAEISA